MTAPTGPFATRHIGPRDADQEKMLAACGFGSLQDLVSAAVPASIRTSEGPHLPAALTEPEALDRLRSIADDNRPMVQMIGLGYYDTHTPGVIKRNVLENPAWYTAYTAYQPEISQGRLEALMNFQTVVSDLTGLDVAGASLLDEATAAAEAMTLVRRTNRATRSARFLVDRDVLPQTLAVLRTRAEPLGIELEEFDPEQGIDDGEFFGMLLQYPAADGAVRDHGALIGTAHERGAQVVLAADLLALTMLRSPGEFGADVAVGSAQRFGVPLMYGGPHAGYISCRKGLERSLPGRLVGASVDVDGYPAYRFALQTREQHIRREKATSNICTAQVLLAVIAGMYAVYHGPEGLRDIARRVHGHAARLADRLRRAGVALASDTFFDTVQAHVPGRAAEVVAAARERGVNLRLVDADRVGVSCDETTTADVVDRVCAAFGVSAAGSTGASGHAAAIPEELARTTAYLTHPVFHRHRSETAMLRYLRALADEDYALDRGMIPLGSCTMKLNPTTAMEPITWPEFAGIHPFAPAEDATGYLRLIEELQGWLAEMTGYAAVSVQPNAGSVGELAGLLAIRAYHRWRGEPERDICLIPSSAHGTNAASAVMAGMRVVVVSSAEDGTVDLDDLRAKLEDHGGRVSVIMVTYPSTHGVYEEGIRELCDLVHDAGGQVYVDGANLNALVGLSDPGSFGGDVSHLNLHKTFCIPHGGGGPGVGPIGVREHLVPFLPGHPMDPRSSSADGAAVGPMASAPFGSAGILPISWAYIAMMGEPGLTEATRTAVLSANYVAQRLAPHYPVLYTGQNGLVAHECIVDLRPLTKQTGVTVDDVAKRLVDYGFHAPTMSFPVAGTFMVEPTESEDLAELDRFCDAMIAIRQEADKVGEGEWPADDNPLHNAPHTTTMLAEEWNHPYTREQAAFPVSTLRHRKYWAPVRRIDQAYGDRNLVCTCPPPEAFSEV